MAILKHGILGPVSNKVGTVIGRNFRGLNVITQLYNTSQKPATVGQKLENNRLTMLSSFLSDAQWVIVPGFTKTAKAGQSALNAAYSYNYPNAFIEENDALSINFPKIVFSRGPVEQPNCATVKMEGNQIIFNWLAQAENKYNRHDDHTSFLIHSANWPHMIILQHTVTRSSLRFEFELPETRLGDTLHCFMLFSNRNGKLIGNSEYIGKL